MSDYKLHILGSGSAMPTRHTNQSSQILSVPNKSFMIDCGEATQVQMVRYGISTSRLSHIFISHLHGDHCFGLIGLLSTLGMKSNSSDIYIHSHPALEALLTPAIHFFCRDLPYKVYFEPFSTSSSELIFEDRSLSVSTIPLKHTLPTVGFLFKEKQKERHIIREKIDFFHIPVKDIPRIKLGEDFVTSDGEIIPNAALTTAPSPSVSYAYCSDTLYTERILPYIEKVDLLFHEATFLHEHLAKAKATMHSTALQAASLAKLADVKQLMIGHYSARYESTKPLLLEAQSLFPNTIAASDGLIHSIG